jgi:hypothetical protein
VNDSRQIQGIYYTKSFAPVVQWSTIHMVNTLAAMHDLKGKKKDFTQAFPRAKLKEDIYLRFPAGFEHQNDKWALKLKQNLYGLVQASRTWFLKLSAIYKRLGFKQSTCDPCLFLRKDMIIVLYTDDCLLYARDTTDIDKFVKTLRDDYKLTLNDPYHIDDFLGIRFSHQYNGELHMSQTGIIEAVTESAHIPKGRLKNTPTQATAILHADIEGLARQESWNYSSVIGQLNYLAQNSRPDIPFTVHQCARYSKGPKALHEKAAKRIIYYLQCTRDKTLIMKPNKNLSLDAYCDSDFDGVWHQEFAHLCDSCLSRTGFIIVLAGVPIHWSSKLQTEIALSSTEAEYIALSQCCRALLPMRRIIKDILSCDLFPNSLKIHSLSTNTITTRKFEHHYHSNSESKLEPSII